jgi:hypothetical protein
MANFKCTNCGGYDHSYLSSEEMTILTYKENESFLQDVVIYTCLKCARKHHKVIGSVPCPEIKLQDGELERPF